MTEHVKLQLPDVTAPRVLLDSPHLHVFIRRGSQPSKMSYDPVHSLSIHVCSPCHCHVLGIVVSKWMQNNRLIAWVGTGPSFDVSGYQGSRQGVYLNFQMVVDLDYHLGANGNYFPDSLWHLVNIFFGFLVRT